MSEKRERPLGIIILAAVLIIGAIMGFGTFIYQQYQIQKLTSGDEFNSGWYAAHTVFLLIWKIVSAIGLWRGRKWGWWSGALLLLGSIFANIYAITSISMTVGSYILESSELMILCLKMVGDSIINALFVAYLFRKNVLTFCGLSESERLIRCLALLGASLLLYLCYYGSIFLLTKFA